MTTMFDDSTALREGPWRHRFVDANGSRFHIAEAGTGPMVLLLHGYPEFWWSWRNQIPYLAERGYRAVAVDLRGYGASDKTPRGYDAYTMAADVTGLIRVLGERNAAVVGHDLGGILGFAAAAFHPNKIRSLMVLGAAHPLRQRAALAVDPRGQLRASAHLLAFQLPRWEHKVTAHDARKVAELMWRWAGPTWRETADFRTYVRACRDVIQIPQASFCALEAFRWPFRTAAGLKGRRFVRLLQRPTPVPTLQLHGANDTCVLPRTAQGSGRYIYGRYEWHVLPGVGHFPQQEAPATINDEIARWLEWKK
ncbi:alpha/beta hydrolase [Natronoglycomyces albus]|uniref:Alpha/beta hydrolase n=2 Tax=Natronoglycomyces albus TaxID=2811108 RepID=A0A895XQQ3_9ACTN|nr:alpha/beta hydrolase [Natronoglycomyces albus]